MSQKFSKYFILYTFAYIAYVVVLTQRNELDHEIDIAFMSHTFNGEEKKYLVAEKKKKGL